MVTYVILKIYSKNLKKLNHLFLLSLFCVRGGYNTFSSPPCWVDVVVCLFFNYYF